VPYLGQKGVSCNIHSKPKTRF